MSALTPLETLLQDPEVTEIMVDRVDRVLVDRRGELVQTEVKFESPAALRAAIDAALALGGVTFEPNQAIAYARLPDDSRVMAVLPPVAVDGPYLVLRKVMQRSPMTWERLLQINAITSAGYELLQNAVQTRQNILVAGGTGSGKTTILNLLSEAIYAEERVIVAEPIVELQSRHPRLVRLSADNGQLASYADVITAASRMRPERLLFGELRGVEVMQILEVIGQGHDGSMMTIHANSAEDALARMEAMCLMANLGLGLSEIRYRIANTINVITTQQRFEVGRRITSITELYGLENDRYLLQTLMRYHPEDDSFEMVKVKPSWQKQ